MKAIVLRKERDVTLSPYIATDTIRPAFLLAPGGGYMNCDAAECAPVAKALNDRGYNAFILRYSVGKHYQWPYPLDDFEHAMKHIADNAAAYRVNPNQLVATGFSAGGHVVACAASSARRKPLAAILCYGLTARETLSYCAPDAPDASELVHADTCPCFLASSRNDWVVPIENTTRFIEALQRHAIDYEAHIYGFAMHGFSIGEPAGAKGSLFCARVGDWLEEALSWVDELASGRYVSIRENAAYQDAHASRLSTRNSCALLAAHPDAMRLLKRKFPAQYIIYAAARGRIGPFLETVALRNLYQLAKVSDELLDSMDEALAAFPIGDKKS